LAKSSTQLAKEQLEKQTKTIEDAIVMRIERNQAFLDKLKQMERPPPYA
jgi:hypothetical protein